MEGSTKRSQKTINFPKKMVTMTVNFTLILNKFQATYRNTFLTIIL